MAFAKAQLSWKQVLLNLKSPDPEQAPERAIGDGAPSFREDSAAGLPGHPRTTLHGSQDGQRSEQTSKECSATGQANAERHLAGPNTIRSRTGLRLFPDTFATKYPQATECLPKDRSELPAYCDDFPAEIRCHIRTTRPIESTFATIRLRYRRTRRDGSAKACLTMMFKPAQSTSKRRRKLQGCEHLKDKLDAVRFINGVNENTLTEKVGRRQSPKHIPTQTAA